MTSAICPTPRSLFGSPCPTRVSWPYFDDAGTPQTENVEILERFTVSGDGNRLEYSMTVTDPAAFVEPVNLSWYWIDIGEEMVPVELCPDAEY